MPTIELNGEDTGIDKQKAIEFFTKFGSTLLKQEGQNPASELLNRIKEFDLIKIEDVDLERLGVSGLQVGYLAPDTDPNTIPPGMLPYVRMINLFRLKLENQRVEFKQLSEVLRKQKELVNVMNSHLLNDV